MTISATNQLAIELIRCPSVTPLDEGCQELIKARLAPLGFAADDLHQADVKNLWATRGDNGPIIVFAGHTDVVPTGPVEQWQHPPFAGHTQDGYLHGRGAADMKGSIAAMVTATERFITKHPNHSGRIGYLITSDEEGPALHGTKAVMEKLAQRDETIDYCIVGEPTSSNSLGDTIKVGRRGSINCVLTIIGQQGHIAYPQLADNAIHRALAVLEEIKNTEWDAGNKQFPPTNLQFSNVHAGTGVTNVIPGALAATFNLRFSPEITDTQIRERVEAIVAKHKVQAKFEWTLSGQPFQTQYADLVQAVEKAIEKHTDKKPELSTSGGTSDGRFIAPSGAQVIELGPINATIHQVDEKISMADLDQLSEIYESVLENLLLN